MLNIKQTTKHLNIKSPKYDNDDILCDLNINRNSHNYLL